MLIKSCRQYTLLHNLHMFVAIPEPKYIIYQEDTHKWRIRKGWENGQAISVERKPIHPNKHAMPCT